MSTSSFITIRNDKVVKHVIEKAIDKVIKMYSDDMYWKYMGNTIDKRRLAIANLNKFKHYLEKLSKDEITEKFHYTGFISNMEVYPDIMCWIIMSKINKLIWKPRYVLALMLLIGYVLKRDWTTKLSISLFVHKLSRQEKFIRVGEYLDKITTSEYKQKKIRSMYESFKIHA